MKKNNKIVLVAIAVVVVVVLVTVTICSLAFNEPTAKFEGKEAGKTDKISYEQLADRCEEFAVEALTKPNVDFIEDQIESYNKDIAESTIAEIKDDTYAEFVDVDGLRYDPDRRVLSGEMRYGGVTRLNFYGVLGNSRVVSDVDCYFNNSGEVIKIYSANADSYIYADGEISE